MEQSFFQNKNFSEEKASIARTLRVIGSKWTILIIRELDGETKRFGQIKKSLPAISSKILSARLKDLEKEGIVERKVFAQIPPKVEYSLTERGSSLSAIISKMSEWGGKIAVG